VSGLPTALCQICVSSTVALAGRTRACMAGMVSLSVSE